MQTNNMEHRITDYWNKRSRDFSRVKRQELAGKNASLWFDLISAHLPEKKPQKILDVGTGAGFFSILFALHGHEAVGIDMSPEMIREARINAKGANCVADFSVMNAQQLDFADQCFDVVISRNLTWTLPDVAQAYREWRRVLKPMGVLLNFDSDCGKTVFSKSDSQNHVHATLTEETINECNAIKSELKISYCRRPEWDVNFLSEIGFNVTYDDDVSPLVYQDQNLQYDDIALFGIYAQKCD